MSCFPGPGMFLPFFSHHRSRSALPTRFWPRSCHFASGCTCPSAASITHSYLTASEPAGMMERSSSVLGGDNDGDLTLRGPISQGEGRGARDPCDRAASRPSSARWTQSPALFLFPLTSKHDVALQTLLSLAREGGAALCRGADHVWQA